MTMDEALKARDTEKPPDLNLSDDDIDCSDIPALTPEQLKGFRPLWVNGRMNFPRAGEAWAAHVAAKKAQAAGTAQTPGEAPVPVNLDPDLVEGLKREAKKKHTTYETLIRRILRDHLAHAR